MDQALLNRVLSTFSAMDPAYSTFVKHLSCNCSESDVMDVLHAVGKDKAVLDYHACVRTELLKQYSDLKHHCKTVEKENYELLSNVAEMEHEINFLRATIGTHVARYSDEEEECMNQQGLFQGKKKKQCFSKDCTDSSD